MGNLLQIVTARRLQDAGHVPYALVGGRHRHDRRPQGLRGAHAQLARRGEELGRARSGPRSSRSCPSRATTPRRWSTTTTGPRACRRSTSCATSASTSRSTGCSPATWCGPGSRTGISYTEFSYVLLQSMDYLNLHRDYGVTLQFGGSDQWGNLTGGVELIRRADGDRVHALRHPADHPGRRHEVRQDRGRRPVARPGDALAVRLLPVLAQRRGREGRRAAAGVHLPQPRGDRGPRGADRREAVPAGRAEGARRARDHPGARRRGDRADPGGLRRPVRRRARCASSTEAPSAAALREAGAAQVKRGRRGCRRSWTCWSPPGCPRARARPGARCARAAPTSTTSACRTPTSRPSEADLLGGAWLVLRRGKKNLAGVEVVG